MIGVVITGGMGHPGRGVRGVIGVVITGGMGHPGRGVTVVTAVVSVQILRVDLRMSSEESSDPSGILPDHPYRHQRERETWNCVWIECIPRL